MWRGHNPFPRSRFIPFYTLLKEKKRFRSGSVVIALAHLKKSISIKVFLLSTTPKSGIGHNLTKTNVYFVIGSVREKETNEI